MLGRTTYQELAAYWTGDLGANFDQQIADRMNTQHACRAFRHAMSDVWTHHLGQEEPGLPRCNT